ncbi:lasso peptide biosynthesis B2 protein [Butyrivibrio sp. JL13D10]|uniref:lasso peptide biosynthesis B2 protein n=1 Tax=Butyrivibrio sp. JL13D10 TaxID=3236815 RepID=UPI0038B5D84E
MINIKSFIFENGEKSVTLKAYIYSFYYRLMIKLIPMKKIEPRLGKRGEETALEESIEHLRIAKLYAFHVNRITKRLPWEEKCFVRALTLRKLLGEKHIPCTIYMGVYLQEDKLKAHAWLRCGQLYATGGNGEGLTIVAKFANFF